MAASSARLLDCLVIGAGPAGLTAATYLARFRRDVLVVDAGRSRAQWIPASHNCPGFPFGVAGNEVLARFRTHAEEYGVPFEAGSIERLEHDGDCFVAHGDARSWRARNVILATGVVDRLPVIYGIEHGIAAGHVRLCAVCDGYEARDDAIAVLAPASEAVAHAEFLRTFSRSVTAIDSGSGDPPDDALRERAREAGIRLLPPPCRLTLVEGGCEAEFDDGRREHFGTLYPVLGADIRSELATTLGARTDDDEALVVDDHQHTSIEGLFAIGDVVSALNQISVAVGHAAIAATAVHRRLPANHR